LRLFLSSSHHTERKSLLLEKLSENTLTILTGDDADDGKVIMKQKVNFKIYKTTLKTDFPMSCSNHKTQQTQTQNPRGGPVAVGCAADGSGKKGEFPAP
jgi:hypothetical protein